MNFDDFHKNINQLEQLPLGGLDAQFKLAPKMRMGYDGEKIKANNPKRAAVLALFYPDVNNETTFLLTKRASYKGTHSAQISFPGGKIEKSDKNLTHTALRETFEEVGVLQNEIQIIREITNVYIPPSNFLATPFFAMMHQKPEFKTNHEVDEIIEVTLKDLLDDINLDSIVMKTSYMDKIAVPCFRLNDHVVWGATGMMLSEIKELIKNIQL